MTGETLLGVEVMDQPTPPRNDGGDCFACCVGAAVRHLHPDAGIDFNWASELFLQENGVYNSSWPGIRKALYSASSSYPLEIRNDLVRSDPDPSTGSHPWYPEPSTRDYCHRLEAWLSAGWVAMAAVHMDGARRGITEDSGRHMTDHFVVFDGVRYRMVEEERGSGSVQTVEKEIHVVDSSTKRPDYRWQDARELIEEHGAAAWWLVRRDNRRTS